MHFCLRFKIVKQSVKGKKRKSFTKEMQCPPVVSHSYALQVDADMMKMISLPSKIVTLWKTEGSVYLTEGRASRGQLSFSQMGG